MDDYKDRLIKEQAELKEKLVKLVNFINSEDYYKLSTNNRLILKNQKIVMEIYLGILNTRIYQDVDLITIPDFGWMNMLGSIYNNSWVNSTSNDTYSIPTNKLNENKV